MDNLTTRSAWAISIIPADRDLDKGITDVALAKVLGTDKNTLARYRQGKGLLKGEVIENLVKIYHFSPQWLFQGIGEPFPGARANYRDVCGSEPSAGIAYIKEATAAGSADAFARSAAAPAAQTPTAQAQQFNIMEDLDLAARVLGSGSHYAAALHLNIRSFSSAISTETELYRCKEDIRKQGDQITQMQINLSALREEIKELRGASGGSPPIALGMENAAPTGTDDSGT